MDIQIIEHIKERVQVPADEWRFVHLLDVLYFESVDNRIFLYTKEDVMEVKQRLYELEIILSDRDFI